MKTVMVIMIVAVLGALASAGIFMMRKGDDPTQPRNRNMARALALRVALSVALFLFVLLSWRMGWVRPSGIPIGS